MQGLDEESLEKLLHHQSCFVSAFFGFPININLAYSLQVHVFYICLSIVISVFIDISIYIII
jgi:hypothetical protein